jgi:hypothetical protein
MYCDSIWFGASLIFFFSFNFSLMHLDLQSAPQKNHRSPSFSFLLRFNPCFFICNFFSWQNYFKLEIIFNFILQFFYLSNLIPILYIVIFFYLGWFIKLMVLLFHPHPFLSGLIPSFLLLYFFDKFFRLIFFSNFILKY